MSVSYISYKGCDTSLISKSIHRYLISNRWKEIRQDKYGKGYMAVVVRQQNGDNEIVVFAEHAWGAQVSSMFSLWGLGLFSLSVRNVVRDITKEIKHNCKEAIVEIGILEERVSLK